VTPLEQAASPSSSSGGNDLLATIDVVGRPGEGGVRHQVDGERGDVRGADDAPDGKRGAELVAALFELLSEQRRRQWRVDESGGDEVEADGGELECEYPGEGGQRRRHRRRERKTDGRMPGAGATHEQQRPAGSHLVGDVAGHVEREPEMRLDIAARLLEVDVAERC